MRRWLVAAAMIAVGVALTVRISGYEPAHEQDFSDDGLLAARADALRATAVTPHLEAPVQPGQNTLWCGTFQLVWNEICTLIGEDLHFTTDPPMVAPLNRKAFVRSDLDEASHVSLAGFVRDGIFDKIPQALRDKFGGGAVPRYLPNPKRTPRPQDIVGYSYLFKHLEFAVPFERLDEPLNFAGTLLPAFGLGPFKPAQVQMLPQVLILKYNGPDDFVIELRSTAGQDRLILAKVKPAATLGETVSQVLARAGATAATEAEPGDRLAVPLLNFDITREYRELYGRLLVAKSPQVAKDLEVLSAIQNIRFQMDEKGVRLKSESSMSIGCAAESRPYPQHIMVFDKPFLVLMTRVGAEAPYFALWVDNPELLVRRR